jgi:hypothetical protein
MNPAPTVQSLITGLSLLVRFKWRWPERRLFSDGAARFCVLGRRRTNVTGKGRVSYVEKCIHAKARACARPQKNSGTSFVNRVVVMVLLLPLPQLSSAWTADCALP